ncbi:MAG: maleylacetoacetate isomerase [Bdellovibrionaceae bacterium]|nr:maleylacetoacetate isomerase [Pseudobdellovibrionaceae bacterium]
MTLYNYYRSSASYRVRIILNYKKIDYKYVPVHLINNNGEHRSAEYTKINSLQQVPSLVHNQQVITQSMAIAQYLEDIQPKPQLLPTPPLDKAYVLQICEIINSGIQPLQNLSVLQKVQKNFKSEEEAALWCPFWIKKGFVALEKKLQTKSNQFALGNTVSLADVFIVPQLYAAYRYNIDLNDFPCLKKIESNTKNIEAFANAHPNQQVDFPG